jgi:hypothetical protein
MDNGYTQINMRPAKIMLRVYLFFISFVVMIFTSGCHRLAATPQVDIRILTPAATIQDSPSTANPTPTLDLTTEQTLQLYPLRMGNTWVYEYLGYDQSREVVWRVVETVVETRIVDGYYVAELERSAELLEGNPPPGFLTTPETGKFWYLIDGQNIYRFEDQMFTNVSGAWLDLVLPFPENNQAWFPNPDHRASLDMQTEGFRYASKPFKRVLPMGGTYTCYNVATSYVDGTVEGTFCETVGFVYQEFNYDNRAFGYHSELRGFSIQ